MGKQDEVLEMVKSIIADAMLGDFDEEDIERLSERLLNGLKSHGTKLPPDKEPFDFCGIGMVNSESTGGYLIFIPD